MMIESLILHSSLQYYIVPFLQLIFTWSVGVNRNPCFFLWVLNVIFPFIDYFLPLDLRNPTKEESKQLESSLRFKFPIYLAIIFDWLAFISFHNFMYNNYDTLSFMEMGLIIVVSGLAGGSNINVAHELVHKNNRLDNILGMSTLSKNLYMHFYIEHNHGHHRRVATHEDPATSRLNESLYQFLPRSIVGSYLSAWNYEQERISKIEKKTKLNFLNNRVIWYNLSYIVLALVMLFFYGKLGMFCYLVCGVISFVFLEIVNYIEHYGLQRKEISPGVYEKVNITHSWNAPHRFSNYLLFKLQRHSDHHENAYKPYQTLCSYDESPFLPQSYAVCMIIATHPKVWFEVMNEMLEQYKSGKQIKDDKVRNRKILGVMGNIAVFFTGLLICEMSGVTKWI